ncbi:MBL fold metallo-hydrolase [Streptomyces lonarensis]|uniref:MBL fold metallo-hydrolase n=1 Tax=Streptomyces lonarensis TaxID=700599 RepID=A0A7X6D2I1_9ACTN|nr:MBL fold metallo-hydrolase [Streptomyces lonarensis]NJQ06818.1 MBL fold metallo-hydrolase [Streptomyces lonarensis]
MTDAAAPPGEPETAVTDGPVTERATCLLAPNPSMMTLDGTNTWVLAEPGAREVVVVDPGPLDEEHLARVAATATAGGRTVALTLLTHGHPDHSDGAERFAELTGSAVRARDAAFCRGAEPLVAGELLLVDGLRLSVIPAAGHTADSVALLLTADGALLSGDTVLGRGTTVVDHPDGDLGDYLDTLRRLRATVVDDEVRVVLPGHGPVLRDPVGAIDFYLVHRAKRLAQVESAVEAGHRTPAEVVAHVYADVDRSLWPVAERSVRAQLEYLTEHGLI